MDDAHLYRFYRTDLAPTPADLHAMFATLHGLRVLLRADRPATPTAIAVEAGFSRPTIYRSLRRLAELGLVVRVDRSACQRPALWAIAAASEAA